MNLKSKILGTLAASAMALGILSGAAAETDTTTATAVLTGGQCSVQVTGNVGLGGWTYDGYVWNLATGTDNDVIEWNLKAGNPAGCDVRIGFNGLDNEGHHIGLENFYADLYFDQTYSAYLSNVPGLATGDFGADDLPSGPASAYLRLVTVPDTAMPGTYTGTISTTVSNSQ